MGVTTETCAHCGKRGTDRTVEWNPVDEAWQCRDVVGCARRAAEARLTDRLRRELGGR